MNYGKLIYYHRKQKAWSQAQLCQDICSVTHLSKIENGSKEVHFDLIEELLKKLNVNNLDQLIAKINLVSTGQKGGDIFDFNNIEDDIYDMDGGFIDFFIGGDEPPSTISLGIVFNKPETQYANALAKINAKTGFKLNACAVVDEGIVNKSVLEFLYII